MMYIIKQQHLFGKYLVNHEAQLLVPCVNIYHNI